MRGRLRHSGGWIVVCGRLRRGAAASDRLLRGELEVGVLRGGWRRMG